jgi:hypothetical protein
MRYPNGDLAQVGDTVELWPNCYGEVVCSVDDDQYTDEFTAADWSYLKKGILVRTGEVGLIHYIESEPSMRLIKRSS